MAKNQAAPLPPGVAAEPKSKLKLIILMVVALLLAVGLSVAGTWFVLSKSGGNEARPAEPAEGATSLRRPAVYEDLSPAFVINYRQGNRQRYLQVSIALMARDEERLKALRVHMPVLRNELVMLLSGQDFDSLLTPVGKEMLRQQVTAKVQELALKETGHQVVEQVLFTNLVLQ